MGTNTNMLVNLVLLLTTISLTACKKLSSYDYPDSATSYGILTDDQTFSYFRFCIDRAELSDMLDGNQDFTVLAPTNRAFLNQGYTMDALKALSIPDLSNLVKNHLVPGKIDIVAAGSSILTASSGFNVKLENIDEACYVDGGDVATTNQQARNGYFNVINKVLSARPTIKHIIENYANANAQAQLSFLFAAVQRAGTVWGDLAGLLEGNGSHTFFAPNNGAFIDAGYTTLNAVQSESPEVLADLLAYQFIAGKKLTTDFADSPVTAYNGVPLYFDRIKESKVTLWYANGITFGNNTPSNLLAVNGVVHTVARFFPQPESVTTLEAVRAQADLTMFNALISKASEADAEPNFVELFSDPNASYTVFAVNDAGLQRYGLFDISAINEASPAALAKLLKFHIIPKRINNINIGDGGSVKTLLSEVDVVTGGVREYAITFERTGGFAVKGPANQQMIPVITPNVVTRNGLLNIVGTVLVP